MLHLSSSCSYYLHRPATDMRKGFDSLCGIVTSGLQMDALSGSVFIFINKKRNQVKLLLWEGDGFSVYYKRLEKGTFEIPGTNDESSSASITAQQLQFILQGISIDYKVRYEQQLKITTDLQFVIEACKHQIAQFQKMMFGSRHERFEAAGSDNLLGKDSVQLSLGLDADTIAVCKIMDATEVKYIRTKTEVTPNKPLPGHAALPEHLRRETPPVRSGGDYTTTRLLKLFLCHHLRLQQFCQPIRKKEL